MKNRSFVRLWAPLIAALIFAAAFLAAHFTMNPSETAKATGELNALMDMAEARAAAQNAGDERETAADEAAIHKARTMERFLAHDDTLLQTDALLVLCELTGAERVAVLDGEGGVIAASDASLLGQSFAADADMAWCMALLLDGAQPAASADGADGRMAGAPRTDIDGVVLIWSREAVLNDAAGADGMRGAVENLAVEPDALKLVETAGENGVFEQDNMLYVQRAEGEVTLIASRPLAEVHAVQNAVLTCLAVFAALTLALLFIWQFIPARGGDEPAAEEPADEMAEEAEPPLALEAPKRKKRRRPMVELVEEDTDEEPDEPSPELLDEPVRRPRRKGPRPEGRPRRTQPDEENHDDTFDKIFE